MYGSVVRAVDCRLAGPWFNSGWKSWLMFMTCSDNAMNQISQMFISKSSITRNKVKKKRKKKVKKKKKSKKKKKKKKKKNKHKQKHKQQNRWQKRQQRH